MVCNPWMTLCYSIAGCFTAAPGEIRVGNLILSHWVLCGSHWSLYSFRQIGKERSSRSCSQYRGMEMETEIQHFCRLLVLKLCWYWNSVSVHWEGGSLLLLLRCPQYGVTTTFFMREQQTSIWGVLNWRVGIQWDWQQNFSSMLLHPQNLHPKYLTIKN